jgi:hypothetical protein
MGGGCDVECGIVMANENTTMIHTYKKPKRYALTTTTTTSKSLVVVSVSFSVSSFLLLLLLLERLFHYGGSC